MGVHIRERKAWGASLVYAKADSAVEAQATDTKQQEGMAALLSEQKVLVMEEEVKVMMEFRVAADQGHPLRQTIIGNMAVIHMELVQPVAA